MSCAGAVGDEETVEALQDQQEPVVEPVLESHVHLAATPSQAVGDRRPADPGTSHVLSRSTRIRFRFYSISNLFFVTVF